MVGKGHILIKAECSYSETVTATRTRKMSASFSQTSQEFSKLPLSFLCILFPSHSQPRPPWLLWGLLWESDKIGQRLVSYLTGSLTEQQEVSPSWCFCWVTQLCLTLFDPMLQLQNKTSYKKPELNVMILAILVINEKNFRIWLLRNVCLSFVVCHI